MLMSFLDYFRVVLVRKCAGLNAEQLRTTVGESTLTLGRLLRHMAFVEDHWFTYTLLGDELPEPWLGADWDAQPDWEMDTADDCTPVDLAERFDEAVARSRDAITGLDPDHPASRESPSGPTSLRWILIHMIEEYARHCGHADLIREAIDGNVGD
ncbi:MAG: DinB family protein [Ilumatobacteraceae bacterium]|nr:DinB family protein [Ilumatobacteraceae bacterium]